MAKRARSPLTEAAVRNAAPPPGKRQVIVWDGDVTGFGIRCLASGAKTFIYLHRPPGGHATPLKVGNATTMSVKAARKAARALAGRASLGHDPAAERRAARLRERTTVGAQLIEGGAYERHLRARHLVNWRPALSALRRGLPKRLQATEIAVLTRRDLAAAIEAIEATGKRGAASDLRKFAYSFLEWAVQSGFATSNPLAGWRRPPRTREQRIADKERERPGRMLSDEEIRKVWRAATVASFGAFGPIVRTGLLSAMRRSELSRLNRGKHFFINRGDLHDPNAPDTAADPATADRIILDARATKMGVPHEIPMLPMLRAELTAMPQTTSPLVFTAPRSGGRFQAWNDYLGRMHKVSGVKFGMHDLRRTCRSLMTRFGVAEDIAELAIGHQRESLIRRYDRYEAWLERSAAFEKVAAHIAAVVADNSGGRRRAGQAKTSPRPAAHAA